MFKNYKGLHTISKIRLKEFFQFTKKVKTMQEENVSVKKVSELETKATNRRFDSKMNHYKTVNIINLFDFPIEVEVIMLTFILSNLIEAATNCFEKSFDIESGEFDIHTAQLLKKGLISHLNSIIKCIMDDEFQKRKLA
jgi:hypothetical protein